MKLLLPLFIVFTTITVQAFDFEPVFLKAKGNGLLASVSGDGYEAGFEIELKNVLQEGDSYMDIKRPTVVIRNNHADCDLYDVEIDRVEKVGKYLSVDFKIFVTTAVEGDSGGCIAMVEDQKGDLLKVVDYNYTTDF